MVPILSKMNPINIVMYFLTIHFNIILSTARTFSNQNLVGTYPPPPNAIYMSLVICYDLISLTISNSVEPEAERSSPHSQQPATGPYPKPIETTQNPSSQYPSYIHFSVLRSCQIIRPAPKLCLMFHKIIWFYGRGC
jgi:hypothetical protein